MEKKRKIRGYFGVVFFEPKFKENIGTAKGMTISAIREEKSEPVPTPHTTN